jgi:hypothetical protein
MMTEPDFGSVDVVVLFDQFSLSDALERLMTCTDIDMESRLMEFNGLLESRGQRRMYCTCPITIDGVLFSAPA